MRWLNINVINGINLINLPLYKSKDEQIQNLWLIGNMRGNKHGKDVALMPYIVKFISNMTWRKFCWGFNDWTFPGWMIFCWEFNNWLNFCWKFSNWKKIDENFLVQRIFTEAHLFSTILLSIFGFNLIWLKKYWSNSREKIQIFSVNRS